MRGIFFRFVALALALGVLGSPAAALVACLSPGGAPAAQCHCCALGRAHTSQFPQIRATRLPCCEISAQRPVPPVVPNAPTTASADLAAPRTVTALATPALPLRHGEQDSVAISGPSSPQAVLCTFLI